MEDKGKTKDQLITELETLRRRVAELEKTSPAYESERDIPWQTPTTLTRPLIRPSSDKWLR